MAEGAYYVPNPPTGVYRVGFAVYGPAGVTISNQIWSTLYVTEQKR